MNIFNKDAMKMKSRGLIPKTAWNSLVDLIWALAIVDVRGGMLTRTANGSTISISRKPGGGAEGLVPWRLSAGLNADTDVWEAKVSEKGSEIYSYIDQKLDTAVISNFDTAVVLADGDNFVYLERERTTGGVDVHFKFVVSAVELASYEVALSGGVDVQTHARRLIGRVAVDVAAGTSVVEQVTRVPLGWTWFCFFGGPAEILQPF